MQPDNELLRQYAQTRSEEAFAELVKRHVNLVYSAALRQVNGDSHLAHDVAQSVFTDLGLKSQSLSRRDSLTGWLYTSTYFAANKMMRAEIRRREREEKFMRELAHEPATDADWEKLRPILDAAMHGLNESDREAVLLRYFENRPFAEVGAKLGVNENTARMRVDHALEKLRGLLAKRAITTTASVASVISANAIQSAPPALAATLTTTSLAAGVGTSAAVLKFMTLAKIKLTLSAFIIAGAATTLVLQHHKQQQLNNENDLLRQQIAQLKTENEESAPRLTDNSKSLSKEQFDELLKLRAEVTALREQTNQLAEFRDENRQLREAFTKLAEERQHADDPQTEEQKFAQLEMSIAKQSVLGMIMYAEDHGEQFPTNFDQAGAYFKDSEVRTNLDQFEIVYQGSLSNLANPSSAIVVREIQPWPHNGTWLKAYGFADGHAQLFSSPTTTNFDGYEQTHAPILKNR